MAKSRKPASSSAKRARQDGTSTANATGQDTEIDRLDAASARLSGAPDRGDTAAGSEGVEGKAAGDASSAGTTGPGSTSDAASGTAPGHGDAPTGRDAEKTAPMADGPGAGASPSEPGLNEPVGVSAAPAPLSKAAGTDAESKASDKDAAAPRDAGSAGKTDMTKTNTPETDMTKNDRANAGVTGTPSSGSATAAGAKSETSKSEAGKPEAGKSETGMATSSSVPRSGRGPGARDADAATTQGGAAARSGDGGADATGHGGGSSTPPRTPRMKSGPGFMTMLLGGIAAGAIGYLAAYYTEFRPFTTEQTTDEAQSDPLTVRLDEQAARIAALQDELAQMSQAPQDDRLAGVNETVGGLQTELNDLREAVAGLSGNETPAATQEALEEIRRSAAEGSAALSARLEEIAGQGGTQDAQGLAEFDSRLSTVTEQLGALAAQIEAQEFPSTEDLAALESRVSQINGQIDERIAQLDQEIESRIAELNGTIEAQAAQIAEAEAAAEEETRRVSSRAALSQIEAALENGTAYQDALGAFEASSDAQVPQALADPAPEGVATLAQLQAEYPDLARAGLDASLSQTAGDGALNRIGAFLKSQTGARSLSEKEGADADAILSRAEARLREGDLAAAVEELQALPQSGREAMDTWLSRATRRLEARAALSDLTAQLSSN
ncbi:hypothetical protein [Profundibacterium mesophilum]|uniref:NADH dehydrogenase subunit E n=1 Tax=Profundibacterium mesophilum KAUST100406-0324 TaxID=1037889 RepID=A0A921TBV4_9RHOB|nr:hypothetical protein [Profundibacterium mesophilum]KAF0676290.1 NADH dehydrogenase subunit E [Profundibacterium mesophilum KAUST100406-0324]